MPTLYVGQNRVDPYYVLVSSTKKDITRFSRHHGRFHVRKYEYTDTDVSVLLLVSDVLEDVIRTLEER